MVKNDLQCIIKLYKIHFWKWDVKEPGLWAGHFLLHVLTSYFQLFTKLLFPVLAIVTAFNVNFTSIADFCQNPFYPRLTFWP